MKNLLAIQGVMSKYGLKTIDDIERQLNDNRIRFNELVRERTALQAAKKYLEEKEGRGE